MSNVDPAEIARFDAVAARWWDPDGEMRPLHDLNPVRLAYVEADGALAGREVLDVGCGGGLLSEAMARRGARVTGLDLAADVLAVARSHAGNAGVDVSYRLETAEDHARHRAAHYDIVTCMEMLEHVPDPASVVRACATLARPGGRVFFSTINRNPKSFLFAIVGAEYVLRLLPRGTHEYAKFITPSELMRHCRAAGLDPDDLTGMTYNPLTRVYSLGRDVDVNYLVGCRRAA